jgi:threonine/homoserine/homoserine lactone efflux protein
MFELFSIGFFAGLALAIPVGPMAIMLINTTLERGWRSGAAGASAMATVDFLYALAVFLLGHVVAVFFATWGQALSLAGAAILLFLGLSTLIRNVKLMRGDEKQIEGAKFGRTPLGTFVIFAGATIVNPPTALYFLGIAPTVAQFETSSALSGALTFAIGVFVGSVIWQQTIALTANFLRRFAQNRVRIISGLIGGALIVALAISLALKATL